MNKSTAPFVGVSIARQLEAGHAWRSVQYARAQAKLQPESQSQVQAIAGGYAVYAGPNSPLNKAAGLGLDDPVTAGDLDAVEDFYRSCQAPSRIEVCPLADPSLRQRLREREYGLEFFLNILFRPLPDEPILISLPANTSIHQAERGDAETWIRTTTQGFEGTETPSQTGLAIQAPTFYSEDALCFLARHGSEPVAGGAMVVHDAVTELGGTSTRLAFRGQGLQTALIHTRLNAARTMGCTWAMTLTSPGSPSQHNVERAGFRLAYTTAFMVNAQ